MVAAFFIAAIVAVPALSKPLPNVPADYKDKLVKNDFAWAAANRDKILAKGIKQGLIAESDKLSDEQIWMLIFKPGFSTAEKVTDVSGRGVGMDVVRQNVKELGGRITIESEEGKGTTFRFPLLAMEEPA